MSIRFACPSCSAKINAPDAAAGKSSKCPHCQHAVTIPSTSHVTDAAPTAPPKAKLKMPDLVPYEAAPPPAPVEQPRRAPVEVEKARPPRQRDDDEDDRPAKRNRRDDDDDYEEDRRGRRRDRDRDRDRPSQANQQVVHVVVNNTIADDKGPPPSILVAYCMWCLCFVGLCGMHRIYMGQTGLGLLWLFTGGLCGIGQLIDLILIPMDCRA